LIWDFAWHTTWDRHLREHFRVITFDKRGTGLSDRSLGFGSIEDRVRDVLAVMEASGSARASLIGTSEGAPMSLVMASAHPERVERMVIYGGFARTLRGPDYPQGIPDAVAATITQRIVGAWGTGETYARYFIDSPDEAIDAMAQLERNACTPQMAGKILQANLAIDVRPMLSSIAAPTLVIHNADDRVVPAAWGRVIAEGVPGARYLEFEGDFHCTSYVDQAVPRVEAAVQFLLGDAGPTAAVTPSRVLASVLFTDIVHSTAQAVGIGDRDWSELLSHHDAIGAQWVERLGGRFVKQTGDGMLALFDGPSRCIECARAIRRSILPLGLELRAGVHTGEVELRGDDVGGVGVHISARVLASAAPGEIWVTRTVRDLTIGSAIVFRERGVHALKGLQEEWQLYSVVQPS
jgi:class 3 adenylate cyclase/alpha-beta hydrolase superfamily lysophospholipase